jgi:transposase
VDAALDALPDDVETLKKALLSARTQVQEALVQTALVAAELAVAKAKASEDLAMIAHQKLRIAKL